MPDMSGMGYVMLIGMAAVVGLVLAVIVGGVVALFGGSFASAFAWVLGISVVGTMIVGAVADY